MECAERMRIIDWWLAEYVEKPFVLGSVVIIPALVRGGAHRVINSGTYHISSEGVNIRLTLASDIVNYKVVLNEHEWVELLRISGRLRT